MTSFFSGNMRPVGCAANAADLRTFEPVAQFVNGQQVRIAGLNTFEWNSTSSAADDGVSVIKPTSVSGSGRWLVASLPFSGTLFATGTGPGDVTAVFGGSNTLVVSNSGSGTELSISASGNDSIFAIGGNLHRSIFTIGTHFTLIENHQIATTQYVEILGDTSLAVFGIYPDGSPPSNAIIEWSRDNYTHINAFSTGNAGSVNLVLAAASITHATNPAGDVVITSGLNSGAGANGKIKLQIKTTDVLTIAQQGPSNINLSLNGDYGGTFGIFPTAPTTGVAGRTMSVSAGAGGTGNQNGGNLLLIGGGKSGGGTDGEVQLCSPAGAPLVRVTTSALAFFNTAPIAKPTVTGSRAGNAALASFLTAVANLGLVTDSSTA